MIRSLLVQLRGAFVVAAAITTVLGAAPTAGADPLSDLMSMLPAGYGEGVCHPAAQTPPLAALAAVDCGANSLAGGPGHARYILYPDAHITGDKFRKLVKTRIFRETPCPGMDSAAPVPIVDHSGRQTGSLACGTLEDPRFDPPGQGDAAILWTRLADAFLGHAHGSDVQSLVDWAKASGALSRDGDAELTPGRPTEPAPAL